MEDTFYVMFNPKTGREKSQHTPGPWEIDEKDTLGIYVEGKNIARATPDNHSELNESFEQYYQRSEANARLIAAAPDSHEANIAALQYLCDENPRADRRHEVIAILEAAIAKAKGGAA